MEGSIKGGGQRPPLFVEAAEGRLPLWTAVKLLGNYTIKLSVANGPWDVNLVDFEQHLLLNLRPHITVPILAFQTDFHNICNFDLTRITLEIVNCAPTLSTQHLICDLDIIPKPE